MYSIDFKFVFDPSNPDSLQDDVAWLATIYHMPNYGLVCDASNNGITGTDLLWHSEEHRALIEADAKEQLPDSIDPLRDYIDMLIGRYK